MSEEAPGGTRAIAELFSLFSEQPDDDGTFDELDRVLRQAGQWSQLAGAYESRLATMDASDPERADLLIRLGVIFEDHLGAERDALRRYQEARPIDPRHPTLLRRLRRHATRQSDFATALQIAEVEERLDLSEPERATLLAETGALWERLGEMAEAESRYTAALEKHPHLDAALVGLAALAIRRGDTQAAIEIHERRIAKLPEGARAAAMEDLAALEASRDPERARQILRRVVREDPMRRRAIERLLEIELGAGAWSRVDELNGMLWQLLGDPDERCRFALEAARAQLDDARAVASALVWAERAAAQNPEHAEAHRLRARIYRRTTQRDELIDALCALERIEGTSAERALEIAALHERAGRPQGAVDALRVLLASDPDDADALEMLDRCLGQVGGAEERVKVIEQRIERSDDASERAKLHAELGDILWTELQQAEDAERAYRLALDGFPDHRAAADRLKDLLTQTGRLAELERALVESIPRMESPPEAAHRWCEVARIRAHTSDDLAAVRDAYGRALLCDRGSRDARQGLRALFDARGDAAAQRQACESELADDLAPERRVALLQELFQACRALHDHDAAHRAAVSWSELEAGAAPLDAMAQIAREAGDACAESAALESLERALEDEPEARAVCLRRLGELARTSGRPDAAESAARWLRASMRCHPDPELRAEMLDLYREAGKLSELVAELRADLDDSGAADPTATRLELASALAQVGDRDGAVATLLEAFSADPAHTEVADALESLLDPTSDLETLVSVLDRRLQTDGDRATHRRLATRLASLYLDALGRPRDAVETLLPFADPSLTDEPEHLLERALEASGDTMAKAKWLADCELHLDGPERIGKLLELGAVLHRAHRTAEAIEVLRRADDLFGDRPEAQIVERPLLALAHEQGDLALQLDVLAALCTHTRDPRAHAAFRLERARILVDELDRPEEGLAEIDAIPETTLLEQNELRMVCALCRKAGTAARFVRALEALADAASDPDEQAGVRLELVDHYLAGAREVRDPRRAEEGLRELIDRPATRDGAFERLASLLESEERHRDLADLLRARLAIGGLDARMRGALVARLATTLLYAGDAGGAAAAIRAERGRIGEHPELDTILCRALEASGDRAGLHAVYRDAARSATGSARGRWLRRWLCSLEASGAGAAERLEVVEPLLAAAPMDTELALLRIRLLREAEQPATLAQAIEDVVITGERLSAGRREPLLRELLRLYEGPLRDPVRALAAAERALENDPALRPRAARLAHEVGNFAREAEILAEMLGELQESDVERFDLERRLAIALTRASRAPEARPLLERALARDGRDRDVLRALERTERQSADLRALLSLQDRRFTLEAQSERLAIAKEGFAVAEQLCDSATALRWLRRWHEIEPPPMTTLRRWLGLERAVGDVAGVLAATRALAEREKEPDLRADWLAGQAQIHVERGELLLARQCYEKAVALSPRRAGGWLLELERLAEMRGDLEDRLSVQAELIARADVAKDQRAACIERRIGLLAQHADRREEAARELAVLLEEDREDDRETRMRRLRTMLGLLSVLGRPAEWCRFAEQLHALLLDQDPRGEEAGALERELARQLSGPLANRGRGVAMWQRVLERSPRDTEALLALAHLLDHPGDEDQRARTLEAYAATEPDTAPAIWLEAAHLRWRKLADAERALADVDRALAGDAEHVAAHVLRAELCYVLDQPEGEETSLRFLLLEDAASDQSAARWLRIAELLRARGAADDEVSVALRRVLDTDTAEPAVRFATRPIFAAIGAWEACEALLAEQAEVSEGPARREHLRELARVRWEELGRAQPTCRALEALAEAAELDAQDRARWSEALAALGRGPEALEHRQACLSLLSDMAGPRDWLELAELILAHSEDSERAREACGRALELDAGFQAALRLRIELSHRLGDAVREADDRIALAALLDEGTDAAAELERAARLYWQHAQDLDRAGELFDRALERDATAILALEGAGEVAQLRSDFEKAERCFGRVVSMLRDVAAESTHLEDPNRHVIESARRAAEAAIAQDRRAAAGHYLDVALACAPTAADALESMALLSFQLGQYDRAHTCLSSLLDQEDVPGPERARHHRLLAQTLEAAGDLRGAAAELERAVAAHEPDGITRERAVALLERLEETDRALDQISDWSQHTRPAYQPGLAVRAARLEIGAGRAADARRRLEAVVREHPERGVAWIELARLVSHEDLEEALALACEALERVSGAAVRGTLLWDQALWLRELGRIDEAVERSTAALEVDPSNGAAAGLLADALDRAADPALAVARLEAALEEDSLPADARARIWFAVGRTYAGALEDPQRAQAAFRAALEANPLHEAAAESLADVTAHDPASHVESVGLHRDLLARFPTRPGSWRALAQIAEQHGRESAATTARAVYATLGFPEGDPTWCHGPVLADCGDPSDLGIVSATELLLALYESGVLPESETRHPLWDRLCAPLRQSLEANCGGGFDLPDAILAEIWRADHENDGALLDRVPRLKRRRLRRASKAHKGAEGADLSPSAWREEMLAQAAASCVGAGRLSLGDALRELIAGSTETARSRLGAGGELHAVVESCPAARRLLARVATAAIEATSLR